MNVVYNINHVHHLLNESKKSKCTYKQDRREYDIHIDFLAFKKNN